MEWLLLWYCVPVYGRMVLVCFGYCILLCTGHIHEIWFVVRVINRWLKLKLVVFTILCVIDTILVPRVTSFYLETFMLIHNSHTNLDDETRTPKCLNWWIQVTLKNRTAHWFVRRPLVHHGWCPGGWFNIKTTSYQYRKSHCGDKTILRPSYLHNGISYTGKMTSLYWIRALVSPPHLCDIFF